MTAVLSVVDSARVRTILIFATSVLLFIPVPGRAQAGGAELVRGPSVNLANGPLEVAKDRRRLVHADGTPFFWLGDTAWELFHRLDREEAELYLEDRRSKGFTVIQAVVLAELDGLTRPNAYGALPLQSQDPTRPNEAYFRHVDFVVDRAAEKGMYIAMLPSWGEWVTPRFGKPIFTDPAQGYAYGWFLGNRYGRKPNVVWVLGGDREPTEAPAGFAVWRAMAEGIADAVNGVRAHDGAADYGATFMSYHAFQSSSRWFHADPWVDAHMWGTYHFRRDDPRSYQAVEADRALPDPKPTINAEPPYEDHPINWKTETGWFDDFDARQAAYWTYFAGGAGYTYGAHALWQMHSGSGPTPSPTRGSWRTALELPGSGQMLHLRRLLLSRSDGALIPQQELIVSGQQKDGGHLRAARGDRSLLVYSPYGRAFKLRLGSLPGRLVRGWWYSPRTGTSLRIGLLRNTGTHDFDPPGEAVRANDWVLVLDQISRADSPPLGTALPFTHGSPPGARLLGHVPDAAR